MPALPPSTASSTPSDSLVIFADQVQTLGQNSYPNSFAGAELNAQGQVIVYAVASDDTALLSDIAALNQDRYPRGDFADITELQPT